MTTIGRRKRLTAWGRSSASHAEVFDVESSAEIAQTLSSPAGGVLARGYARSYGDVCLNGDGRILDTTQFAGIESFDPGSGVLVCKAGTSYRQIMRQCLPQGWLPAVCPGTAFVSMGGAIANDVHGKNQHVVGSFGDHVEWFDLRVPSGETVRVTADSEPDLFTATTGGIGLTGVIERLQMTLQAAPSNAMELREERIPDIDTFLDRLRSTESEYTHAVGWLDCVTSGRQMGRGILELARPSREGVREPLPLAVSVPFEFPRQVLNRMTVQMFNAVYLRRVPLRGRERLVHVDKFLYPLDAIHNWNRMYGRTGVYQFQCVMPFEDGRRAIITLMEEIVRSRGASFLAVLKSMNRTGPGLLSFPRPGFTLAMDFPRRQDTHALIERLYDIVIAFGGRVYLAKDAVLSPERFRAMYPTVDRFRDILKRVDPHGLMQSDMSRRLELSGPS